MGIEATLGVALSAEYEAHLYIRGSQISGGGLPSEHTGSIGLCFGACGSTRPTRSSYSPPGPIGRGSSPGTDMAIRGIETKGQASSGPVNKVRDRAEEATRRFVDGLRQKANSEKAGSWQEFVKATA